MDQDPLPIMKVWHVLFVFAALTFANARWSSQMNHNPVIDFLLTALDHVKLILKKYEPYELFHYEAIFISDDIVRANVEVSNIYISKLSSFLVKYLKADFSTLTVFFQIVLPVVHCESDYMATGDAKGNPLNGAGHMSFDLHEVVLTGFFGISNTIKEMKIKDMKLNCSLDRFDLVIDGLMIEEMPDDEADSIINRTFSSYIREFRAKAAEFLAFHIRQTANQFMEGKTFEEIIEKLNRVHKETKSHEEA